MDDILPDNVFSLKNDDFYAMVETLVGSQIVEILKFQMICSMQSLVRHPDIFEIFSMPCSNPDFLLIREKSCFLLDTGLYIIKPGLKNNLDYLIHILQRKQNSMMAPISESPSEGLSNDFIKRHPVLQKLISWYRVSEEFPGDHIDQYSFLREFIDNITSNITSHRNTFRYCDSVRNFALSLYIMGGKLTYEFIRLNLPGSLPSLSMLSTSISDNRFKITEGKFRFDAFRNYMNDIDVQYAFGSEDCTGVIKKVEYDTKSDTFIGFPAVLNQGIPAEALYQTDSYDKLKLWFNTIQKASLLNVHMVQPLRSIVHANTSSPFLLSAYGTDSSTTANDILQRWWFIYERCLEQDLRIIGFSTGNRYIKTVSFRKYNKLKSISRRRFQISMCYAVDVGFFCIVSWF